MAISALNRYEQLCTHYGQKKIVELEIQLQNEQSVIDASCFYLPRKHLKCICVLLQERSELTGVRLDDCTFDAEDFTLLFESLRESRICSISLKNVKMSVCDGEQLRELCKINPHITEVNLDGTLLPESLAGTILVAVELNKSLEEEHFVKGAYSILVSKKINSPITRFVSHNHIQRKISSVFRNHLSIAKVMNDVISREQEHFTDTKFNFEEDWFNKHFLNVFWERGCSVTSDTQNICSGNFPVIQSTIRRNENLCTALNILQQDENLKNLILPQNMVDIGCFSFRFFIAGTPVEVIIDDLLPFQKEDNQLITLSLHSTSNDIWGSLVEKAMAKLFGGYSVLSSFSSSEYLSLLTGGLCCDQELRNYHFTDVTKNFHSFRSIILNKSKVFGVAIPGDKCKEKALAEKGIVPNFLYTVISTDFYKLDYSMEYLVQLIGPPNSIVFQDAVNCGRHHETTYLGFPVFWMRFEDFCVYFDKIISLFLTFPYHFGKIKNQIKKVESVVERSSVSSSFALNPSFCIEHTGTKDASFFFFLEWNEEPIKNKGIHLYPLEDSCRKYDISKKNQVNSPQIINEKFSGITCEMKPGERYQVTLSSESKCNCILNVLSEGTYNIFPLQNYLLSKEVKDIWDFFYDGVRTPKNIYSFTNTTLSNQNRFIVCLSQELTEHQPYGVSLLVWTNRVLSEVKLFQKPDIETEVVCDTLVVFNFSFKLEPGRSFFLLPRRHDKECPLPFNLTVYSEGELKYEGRSIPLPIFELS